MVVRKRDEKEENGKQTESISEYGQLNRASTVIVAVSDRRATSNLFLGRVSKGSPMF